MPYSGSTRSRSASLGVPLWVVLAGEDHPKACTGRRLLRQGLAREFRRTASRRPGPILLDPRAPFPLTSADEAKARAGGLLVVDCSWNRLERRGGFGLEMAWLGRYAHRRLPWLLAGNPQHYGRVGELNTAEAMAAALEILGEPDRAARVVETFAGGPGFLALNRALLDSYRAARSSDDILTAERAFF